MPYRKILHPEIGTVIFTFFIQVVYTDLHLQEAPSFPAVDNYRTFLITFSPPHSYVQYEDAELNHAFVTKVSVKLAEADMNTNSSNFLSSVACHTLMKKQRFDKLFLSSFRHDNLPDKQVPLAFLKCDCTSFSSFCAVSRECSVSQLKYPVW